MQLGEQIIKKRPDNELNKKSINNKANMQLTTMN